MQSNGKFEAEERGEERKIAKWWNEFVEMIV